MGLYEAMSRIGKTKSQQGASGGFSASRYFTRNAMSATSHLGAPPSGSSTGEKEPLDVRRPYASIGKASVNLMGRPVTPASPELKQMPGAFEGVPVLGNVAQALGGLGSVPLPLEWIPGIGTSIGMQRKAASDIAHEHAEEFLSWANTEATRQGDPLNQDWYQNTRMMVDFARQSVVKDGKASEFGAQMMFTPADDNIGGLAQSVLGGLSSISMSSQRLLAGAQFGPIGGTRVEDLLTRSDEDLEGNEQLIAIRDDYRAGKITRDTALDRLTLEGHAITDPFGQSGPVKFIRSIGDDTPFELVGDIAANTVAATASLGLEVITDPTSIPQLLLTGGTSLAAGGSAKIIAKVGQEAGELAIREAIEQGTIASAKGAAAAELRNSAIAVAQRELYGHLPEGVAATDMNVVKYALKAGDPAVQNAMRAASGLERPFVANQHVLKWIQMADNVLDPLSLFGGDKLGRAGNKAVAIHVINGGTDGLGKRNVGRVFEKLTAIGIDEQRVGGHLGTALANIASQIGGEQVARLHLKMGIGAEGLDELALTDLGQDMLSRHGKDAESMAKHKVAKVMYQVVPLQGETMREALDKARTKAANDLVKMYGVSLEDGLRATKGMSADEIAVVHFMRYGAMADELLNARTASIADAATMKLSPDFVNKVIFLGPTQLTMGKAVELRGLIKAKNYVAIREMVERYDLLEWNISLSQTDGDLAKSVSKLLDSHMDKLPTAIDPANLTPAMRAFKDKYGDSVELGLRSDDIFATGRNADGKIISTDPFMDYVRGAQIGMGDVMPQNILRQHLSRLTNSISGSQIVIEQNRRFAERMSQQFGFTREQSDAMLAVVRQHANTVKAASARGLDDDELYEAAKGTIPRHLKGTVTSRDVQLAMFYALEGSLGKVGLSQKFTGKVKTLAVKGVAGHGTNVLGTISERYYPNVRFKWNLFFQLQEGIETPVLLVARGMISPSQFSGPLTGVRAGVSSAIAAPRGGRTAAFKRGRQVSSAAKRQADFDTAVMMDAFRGGIRYNGDMIEATNVLRAGGAAAGAMSSSEPGRALTALLSDSKIARIKTRGQLLAFRSQTGDNMARMLKAESPVSWATARSFYADGHKLSDGEVAVRWFNDMLMRNDPESAFDAVLANKVEPGQFFRPTFLGRRTRWSEKVVMHALRGEMDEKYAKMSFRQLRQRYLNPKDTVITEEWLENRLRAVGADETYIERTKWRMDYPDEKTWEAFVRDDLLGGDAEQAKAHMDFHRSEARLEGLPLIESLADKYSGHPQILDENGVWKDTTLFQLIADATEARGLTTLPATHEHVRVGGTMSQIGAPNMPDIGLPDAVAELSWEGHHLAPYTELLPLSTLKTIKVGNDLRLTDKELSKLARDIKSRGMQEPIQLTYSVADRTIVVDEGNHRVAGLIQLLNDKPEALAGYNVPVTVFRKNGPGVAGATPVRGMDVDEFGYVPANLRPSDIGLGDVESAAIRRHEASARQTSAVKDLTPGQKKGRTYQQARAKRAADPVLGTPDFISGASGGRLVAKNADGMVTHRIGGTKTTDEWVEELRANMTDEEMAEHAGWYVDMRRGFMALSDNQQEQATHLLMAFGVTQMNTSPIDGMKFMLRVVESMKAGKGLPDDAKALTKVAGLNGVNLKNLMETGYVQEAGMGQKLIDFVDSLIGVDGRTVPVRGPNGTWTAVAGDVWAKRDVGFVDQKMLNHLKHAYGDQYDVTKVNSNTFRFKDRTTGESFTVPAGQSQPSDLEYDHIVQFYNDAADHLNTLDDGKGFLGRNDWVGAEAQALGWFKAKKVFNDPTGDPRSAFFDSVYNTRVDVLPSRTAVSAVLYPSVAEHTSNSIAGTVGHQLSDEAARLSGVHVITSHGSVVRHPSGALGSAMNFEVMASPEGIRHHLAALGALGHQSRVRATRATATKPTAANGMRHMVELSFPASMPKAEMDAIHKTLTEGIGGRGDPTFFGDSDLIVRADGSYAIRVVANPGEGLPAFTKRMDDVQLREWHTQVYGEDGFARGRYIDPDEPMGTGARKKRVEERGNAAIQRSYADPKPITWGDDNIEELADEAWKSVQPDEKGGWGGLTVNLHDGSRPKAYGEKKGGGPFATGITPDGQTISLGFDVGEEEFKQAVRDFVNAQRGDLQRPNAAFGVFRDKDTGKIDLDTTLIVDDWEDVEGIQLVLKRKGGAYDFTSGDGVYSPHFDPQRASDVNRGYAEVIEMDNDWATNANGEGYTQHLGGTDYGNRVRGDLEREGIQWGRMVWEEAYQRVASREVAAHRAARAAAGDAAFDLGNPTGYLQSHPRGTRAATLANGDAARGRRLFQRTPGPGGRPAGAITDAGAALSTSAPGRPRRAQLYISPKRRQADTLAHEMAHDFINRNLHESARRRIKAAYAGREGALPTRTRSRSHVLTVDEQEWAADQLVEYLRQGSKAMKHPSLEPLAAFYSKTLKDKKRRVEPDLTRYTDEERRYQEELSAHTARRAKHETERARQLNPEPVAAPEAPDLQPGEVYEFGPLPEGAQLSPSGARTPHLQWDELVAERARYIKPGETKPLTSIMLSDEDYSRVQGRFSEFITKGSEEDNAAYNAGYAASGRSQTYDLDKASSRYASDNPSYRGTQFEKGWADAANGEPKNPPPKRDMITMPEERPVAPPAQRRYLTAERHEEGYLEARGQQSSIQGVYEKWDARGDSRNSAQMEKDLVRLEQQGIEVSDELNLLDEYRSMERGDFSDAEEYSDARSDAWNDLMDSLDQKHQNYLEDQGFDEATGYVPGEVVTETLVPRPEAVAPPPVDIGEFAEAAPVKPKKPRATSEKVELHPQAKELFDTIDGADRPKNAYAFDTDEENVLKWMYAAHRRADRTSKDLVHFKGDRSWLERSLNHPYFGLYPLSYMWGKVLPEMVEFLMARPFGAKSPYVAYNLVNKMYQHTMNAMENDEELRSWMAENEDALRAIAMLVPGVPWDLPVNSPLWVRRYIEGVATNIEKDKAGEQPEDWNAWNTFVSGIDYQRIVGDTIEYTAGPAKGAETLLSYPALAGKLIGGMQPTEEEELARNPDFIPPINNREPQAQQPLPQQPAQPQQQPSVSQTGDTPDISPDDVQELQDKLGGEFEDVVRRIGEGG